VVLAFYTFSRHERVEEVIDLAFIKTVQLPPKPHVRQPVPEAKAPVTHRILSAGAARSTVKPATVTEFSNQRIMQGVKNPSLEAAAKATSQVATNAKINQVTDVSLGEPSSVPGESAAGSGLLGDQTKAGGNSGKGSGFGRGSFGGGRQDGKGEVGKAPRGLASLTKITDSADVGGMSQPSRPRGEPGGRVIGKGKDIEGALRLARLKHRLSDWWADPTSLTGLANWINKNTNIYVAFVKGGAIELTNPMLMKVPLVIMTGHDPAVIRRRRDQFLAVVQPTSKAPTSLETPLMTRKRIGKSLAGIQHPKIISMETRLTKRERMALRKYLVEKGGVLFYDDCGLNSLNWPLMQILINELRDIIPEYPVMPIPNNHELYNCFYELGGPPWSVASLWEHDGPIGPIPEQLKGVFINDRLAVILSQRDYLCGAKTVSVHAGKMHRLTSAYQFLTNVVVYALTRGGISDYSNYVSDISEKAPIIPPATPDLR